MFLESCLTSAATTAVSSWRLHTLECFGQSPVSHRGWWNSLSTLQEALSMMFSPWMVIWLCLLQSHSWFQSAQSIALCSHGLGRSTRYIASLYDTLTETTQSSQTTYFSRMEWCHPGNVEYIYISEMTAARICKFNVKTLNMEQGYLIDNLPVYTDNTLV